MTAPRILIVESPYYEDVARMLADGALTVLDSHDATYERVSVPGALEIPAVISMAAGQYDAFIALGCVIRGETSHYDIVANEPARAIMDLTVQRHLCIGNGILTVENMEQAIVRADPAQKNKGRDAALAALALYKYKQALEG